MPWQKPPQQLQWTRTDIEHLQQLFMAAKSAGQIQGGDDLSFTPAEHTHQGTQQDTAMPQDDQCEPEDASSAYAKVRQLENKYNTARKKWEKSVQQHGNKRTSVDEQELKLQEAKADMDKAWDVVVKRKDDMLELESKLEDARQQRKKLEANEGGGRTTARKCYQANRHSVGYLGHLG